MRRISICAIFIGRSIVFSLPARICFSFVVFCIVIIISAGGNATGVHRVCVCVCMQCLHMLLVSRRVSSLSLLFKVSSLAREKKRHPPRAGCLRGLPVRPDLAHADTRERKGGIFAEGIRRLSEQGSVTSCHSVEGEQDKETVDLSMRRRH